MSQPVPIVKMSGAGNDFIVVDPQGAARLDGDVAAWARRVCRRGLSVGADGVLLVSPAAADRIRVQFFNPDGSEVFCGNGSRCAARFAVLRGMARSPLILLTAIGDVPARVAGETVTLTVACPQDRGEAVFERVGERIEGRIVLAGVPHLVVFVEDLERAPLDSLGPWLRAHPRFGVEGANVDLVRWIDGGATLGIRTWERGVEGETLACGSGALAAALVAAGGDRGRRIRVLPASGIPLEIEIRPVGDPTKATLSGDARVVFEGVVSPEGVAGFDAP